MITATLVSLDCGQRREGAREVVDMFMLEKLMHCIMTFERPPIIVTKSAVGKARLIAPILVREETGNEVRDNPLS